MTFFTLAQRISNGDTAPLESYLKSGYDSGIRAYLHTTLSNRNISMVVPDTAPGKKEWFRLEYPALIPGTNPTTNLLSAFKMQLHDRAFVAKFIENLSECQTIADLILATNGDLKNVAIFKASLQIISDRISILDLENQSPVTHESKLEIKKRTSHVIQITTKVINLCNEFFALKRGVPLSIAPFLSLETSGLGMPVAPCSHFTDETLLNWALSLSSEQKEKVVFFDFNQYPELTGEIPFKLKQIFPNLSFSCFGTLPDSMCDVTLFGDSAPENLEGEEIQRSEGEEIEKEGKGKEKEVWDEETGKYYFPGGNKRKGSPVLNPGSPKRVKLSPINQDLEIGKDKEKVESEESSKVNDKDKPEGIKTNKKILASSSEFFNQLFYGGFDEENKQEILLREVKPHILKMCIDAFYLRTDLKTASLEDLFEVYKTAFYLGLKTPKAIAEAQIISLLETSSEQLFLEKEIGKEKETDGISEEKRAMAVETSFQKMGQYYVDVSHIFLLEPTSLLKKRMVRFLQKELLSLNPSSYKNLFVRFLEANLPLVEVIEALQENVEVLKTQNEESKDLDKLYDSLWQASLECRGQSFKEIIHLCRKYWELSSSLDKSLKQHIRCANACLKMNSSIEVKKVLLASLLKAAQVGDDTCERARREPLMCRGTKTANGLKNKFFNAFSKLMKSIKGDSFEISEVDANEHELFSLELMKLSSMATDSDELKIRFRSASIAAKVSLNNHNAYKAAQIFANPRWERTKKDHYNYRPIAEPMNAIRHLKFLCPEVANSDNLEDFLSLGLTSNNPVVLSLCSVLHYYAYHQDWNRIFETAGLAIQYDPMNELALSLYGASLIHLAKVKPEESEALLNLAKQHLDKSLTINPKNTIALTYLANWHLERQEKSEAIAIFKKIKNAEHTIDNFHLIKHMLLGSPEEREEGGKILLRTLKNQSQKLMDINWFHLFALYAIQKNDAKLLDTVKTFFEDCFLEGAYNKETLHMIARICKVAGPIEKEKKEKIKDKIGSTISASKALKGTKRLIRPSKHLSYYVNSSLFPILDLSHTGQGPMDLSQFDLEEYLKSIDDDDKVVDREDQDSKE
ncbi:BTB/POZ domain-containing protein [Criblamydia sequanensis]|uniref:BTB domain-containing protein n=1 Tax=Candidatus Criblamydia sequanensis CRIB-18 TaxID=1437425 RepID=A0A090CZY7_9BACT|nr:BTB/POZ domain-containing protein [Criblamydia sequanensis]CDR33110.1 hypothetical protein CSEC_0271 [Criblamydia sequanensis CRIB-18]